jgi:hypothetical protein
MCRHLKLLDLFASEIPPLVTFERRFDELAELDAPLYSQGRLCMMDLHGPFIIARVPLEENSSLMAF